MKAIGIVGSSGSGKTTLIERLIPVLVQQGFSVSALKHAHRGFDIDRPGKDSFRLRAAGASQVMIAAPERWALMTEVRGGTRRLDQLLAELAPCDLVLVEGFRREGSIPRIEVRGPASALRATAGKPAEPGSTGTDSSAVASGTPAPEVEADPHLIAVVCDDPVDSALPRFMRDDVAAVAAFIVQRLGIER